MKDLIDRQAAIDALGERPLLWTGGDYELGCANQYDLDKLAIETVPPAQPDVPDTNVGDMISRQAAIEAVKHAWAKGLEPSQYVEDLPSAQPEIIHCRECKFASGNSRICMKFGHSPIGELDFCAWAERRTDDGE